MQITFLGAADAVTGSRHLVDVAGARILLDCGHFQGFKTLRERNWARFPVAAGDPVAVGPESVGGTWPIASCACSDSLAAASSSAVDSAAAVLASTVRRMRPQRSSSQAATMPTF